MCAYTYIYTYIYIYIYIYIYKCIYKYIHILEATVVLLKGGQELLKCTCRTTKCLIRRTPL